MIDIHGVKRNAPVDIVVILAVQWAMVLVRCIVFNITIVIKNTFILLTKRMSLLILEMLIVIKQQDLDVCMDTNLTVVPEAWKTFSVAETRQCGTQKKKIVPGLLEENT